MIAKSTRKPKKPYPEFPLFPHASGRWCKKIRGIQVYFGPWRDPSGALQKYRDEIDDLQAGRKPRTKGDGTTIADLMNRFLTAKRHLVDTRELSERSFSDYHRTCETIVDAFGRNRSVADLRSDDFEVLRAKLAAVRGPVGLGNEISQVRIVFKYAFDADLIEKPVKFGPIFRRPSRKIIRRARRARGKRMFEAPELRKIIEGAEGQMRAMVLLAANCAYGQTDVANLRIDAIDFRRGWIDYPRPKTEVARRCPLWKETIEALRIAIGKRPEPKDPADNGLVFITKYGAKWVRTKMKDGGTREFSIDAVALEFAKLLRSLELKRPGDGLNFYAIRHGFQTVGDTSTDSAAVSAIMGHTPDTDDMGATYNEKPVSDKRLKTLVDYVHHWLWPRRKGKVVRARLGTERRSKAGRP